MWQLGLLFYCFLNGHLMQGQPPKIVKLKDVESIIRVKTNKIQIINFWATWCSPCVKEMPLFENAHHRIKDAEVTLVSLDLDLDSNPEKIFRFVERKNLKSTVLILDETDPNSWIDKIDSRWSGALPATLVVNTNTGASKFVERELREGELELLVEQVR